MAAKKVGDQPGSVFVFNFFAEDMTLLSTNGLPAGKGDIPKWGAVGGPAPYTPASLAVGRVLNADQSPGHFYNGVNVVILQWSSGLFNFKLALDGPTYPLSQDLVLVIEQGHWQLVNWNGKYQADGTLSPGPTSKRALDALLASAGLLETVRERRRLDELAARRGR